MDRIIEEVCEKRVNIVLHADAFHPIKPCDRVELFLLTTGGLQRSGRGRLRGEAHGGAGRRAGLGQQGGDVCWQRSHRGCRLEVEERERAGLVWVGT